MLLLLAVGAFLYWFIRELDLWQTLIDLLYNDDFEATTKAIVGGSGVLGTVYLVVTRLIMPLTSTLGVDPAVLLSTQSQASRLKNLRDQTSFRSQFAAEFKILTEALKPRTLLVFIDDLDRCEPENVMNLLQVLNFLSTSGDCFFVLGMDYQRVEENVAIARTRQTKDAPNATEEKPDAFAKNYLQKLIQVRVPVPHMGAGEARELIRAAGRDADESRDEARKQTADAGRPTRWQRLAAALERAAAAITSPAVKYPALALAIVAAAWIVAPRTAQKMKSMAIPSDDLKKPAAPMSFDVQGVVLGLPIQLRVAEAQESSPPPPATTDATSGQNKPDPFATRGGRTRITGAGRDDLGLAPLRIDELPIDRTVTQRAAPVPWAALAIALVGSLFGIMIALRRIDEAYVVSDSKAFYEAVNRWLPALAPDAGGGPPATPRTIKRFLNRVRLYAMLSREKDGGQSRDPENVLVGLGAIAQLDRNDVLQAVLNHNVTVSLPNLSLDLSSAVYDVAEYLESKPNRADYFRYLVELGR